MSDAFYESYNEDVLRDHIHNMLDDYIHEHLLLDHQNFTHFAVWQLFQSFETVPMIDPYSYRLPVDPLDLLSKIYAPVISKPYDERLQISPAVANYLKASLQSAQAVLESERALKDPGKDLAPQFERFETTILTKRSRGQTLKPGSGRILKDLLGSQPTLPPVHVEDLPDPEIDEDKLTNVSWKLRKEQHTEITGLLKGIPGANAAPHNAPTLQDIVLSQLNRPDSPPLSSKLASASADTPPEAFLSRSRRLKPRADLAALSVKEATDVLKPVDMGPAEESLQVENMVMVDGWQTYQTSSSPVLSSGYGSMEDEVDELALPPTPETEPFQVDDLKMEVPMFSRGKRVGSDATKVSLPGNSQSLHNFFLDTGLGSLDENRNTAVPDVDITSLAGIDGSALGIPDDGSLDQDLHHLYPRHPPSAPMDMIMKETLDEKHVFFMDVPDLPAANVHPLFKHLRLPVALTDFVIPHSRKKDRTRMDHQFLKSAKGLSLLNVDLSWSPFTAPQLPSHMDIADTADTSDMDAVTKLLAIVELSDEPRNIFDMAQQGLNKPVDLPTFGDLYNFHPVLSRQERRPIRARPDRAKQDTAAEIEQSIPRTSTPVHKRPRLGSDDLSGDDLGLELDLQTNDEDLHELDLDSVEILDEELDAPMDETFAQDLTPFSLPLANNDRPSLKVQRDMDMTLVANRSRYDKSMELEHVYSPPARHLRVNEGVTSIFDHSFGVADFALLRAKPVKASEEKPVEEPQELLQPVQAPAVPIVPPDLIDKATLQLSLAEWSPATSPHYYLTSLNVLQKRRLTRCLLSPELGYIELVEREHLSGVDLILDPHNAVIILNLLRMPTDLESVVQLVQEQSWRYARILLLFEGYTDINVNPFSPPTIKAVKKLRRTLIMAEATNVKSAACQIETAFPLSPQEAAICIRVLGDRAQYEDTTNGVLWTDRDQWLAADVTEEDDQNLASAYGMNYFASVLILCQISLLELLGMDPEERIERFGAFVGEARMLQLNEVIEQRMRELALDEDGMTTDPGL